MTDSYTDYENKPGHLARRFQQIAVAVFQAEMEALGLDITPVQYAALAAVSASPGLDQATLAGRIAYDRATLTGVLDRLEAKALLTRRVSEHDRRARVLTITPQGEATLIRISPGVDAAQRRITSGLTAAEAEDLQRLLRKAVTHANDLSRAPRK